MSEAVARLLTMPEPEFLYTGIPWPDYAASCGFDSSDVPILLRLATDRALLFGRRATSREDRAWSSALSADGEPPWAAPIHAWRALAQLRATEALPRLIQLLGDADRVESDWLNEDLSKAVLAFGEVAAPLLADALATTRAIGASIAWSEILGELGARHPSVRATCVSAVEGALARCGRKDAELGGYLVASLIDLQAVEAVPTLAAAFQRGAVDPHINGDWTEVQMELGLIPEDPIYRERQRLERMRAREQVRSVGVFTTDTRDRDEERRKAKAKRKQATASRKRNRKH